MLREADPKDEEAIGKVWVAAWRTAYRHVYAGRIFKSLKPKNMEEKMLKISATAFIVAVCLASCAVTSDNTSAADRNFDTEKYCYYASNAYSEGAVMDQNGFETRCVRAMDSELSSTVPANVLVWQKLK